MMLSINKIAEVLGGDVSGGEALVPGPEHSAEDRSLAVKLDSTAPDGFVVHSFADDNAIVCRDYVRKKLGLPEFEPKKKKANGGTKSFSPTVAKYVYRLADGTPYLQVHRLADKSGFPQYRWDGEKWISGKPKGPKIPYLLPQLSAAAPTTPVYVVEGEKDCDSLAKLGFVATCNSEGADNGNGNKWTSDLNQHFKDRDVYIVPDNDALGRKHAEHVARNLDSVAKSVRIVELPGLPLKGDVSDWLKSDTAGAKLSQLAKAAPLWEPSAGKASAVTDDELIAELAGLSRLHYAKRRKDVAEAIGIGVGELDQVVAEARGDSKDEESLYEYWSVEAADAPVDDGDTLLQTIEARLRKHVAADDAIFTAATLWIAFAWTHDAFVHSTMLLATSKEPDSGKTTLLGALRFLVPRGLATTEISAAALYRTIEKWHPTLLVDEADVTFRENEELRSVFNSGWTRGSGIIRCKPDTLEPELFTTFGPKVIGMKGLRLPDTTLSRCLVLEMKRKRRSEQIVDFLHIDDAELAMLRGQLARWSADHLDRLGKMKPSLPDGFENRLRANWWPLFCIAELCGGKWPEKVRVAAQALSRHDVTSLYIQALTAIREIFGTKTEMFSHDLVEALVAIEDGPWKFYGGKERDKPITQNGLARLLKPIAPENIRIGEKQFKGYRIEWFADAFERYLEPKQATPTGTPQNEPSNRPKCDEIRTSGDFKPSQAESFGTAGKCEKPNNDGFCYGVTVEKGERGASDGLPSRIRELARWCLDRAETQRQENGGEVDQAEIEESLRIILREELPDPTGVEPVFEQVMCAVFEGGA